MAAKKVTNTINIKASPDKIWEVLTKPEHSKKYMFGCETKSDWKVGSTLDWEMVHDGKPLIPVTGTVLEFTPNTCIKYTVIDPFAAYPIIPENHLHVTYLIDEEQGSCRLTVIQDGFETVADGEKRYEDVYNNGDGWNPILVQIKAIAESL